MASSVRAVVEILAYTLIVAAVAALFVAGDRLLSDSGRSALSHFVLGDHEADRRAENLPGVFLDWFDRLLGVRWVRIGPARLPLPRLWRSLVASSVALLFAAFVWVAKKGFVDSGDATAITSHSEMTTMLVLMYGTGAVVSNLLPDYLSLVQSRWVLERMRRTRSFVAQLAWLAADLVATGATVFVVLWLTARWLMPLVPVQYEHLVGCLNNDTVSMAQFWEIFVGGLTFSSPVGTQNYDAAGIYIFSSFFTSFWVWLFFASALLIRVAVFVPGLRRFLRDACRVPAMPLRAVSVAAVIVAAFALALPALVSPWVTADPGSVDGSRSWKEPILRCHEVDLQRHMDRRLARAERYRRASLPAGF
jgi:hypothetical protein